MAEKKAPSGRKNTAGARGKGAASSKAGDKPAAAKTGAAKSDAPKSATTSDAPSPTETTKAVPTTIPASGAKATGPDEAAGTAKFTHDTGPVTPESQGRDSQGVDAKPTDTKPPETEKPEAKQPETEKPEAKQPEAKPTDTRATPTSSAPTPPIPAQPHPRKGGFFPLLLGGICAAAIGFGAAYYLFPQLGITPRGGMTADDIAAKLDQQAARIDTLKTQIDAIPAAPDTSGLETAQTDLAAKIADLSRQLGALNDRMEGVEAQPTGANGEGVTSGQLSALRQALKAQGAKIAALTAAADNREDAARTSARQELRRAALTRIRTALDTGSPFAAALGDLERAGMSAPDVLQDVAKTGVPTQAALQASFAPAARAALAKARKAGDADEAGGVLSFLSDQLGVRSLGRQEGPGADAVLSRAEDDLRQGKLEPALSEIETLPDPARAELSDWASKARTRMQALAALNALVAKLN